jgi:hypothetical protein
MEMNVNDLNYKVYLLKEKVESFEYSNKTNQELINVI